MCTNLVLVSLLFCPLSLYMHTKFMCYSLVIGFYCIPAWLIGICSVFASFFRLSLIHQRPLVWRYINRMHKHFLVSKNIHQKLFTRVWLIVYDIKNYLSGLHCIAKICSRTFLFFLCAGCPGLYSKLFKSEFIRIRIVLQALERLIASSQMTGLSGYKVDCILLT